MIQRTVYKRLVEWKNSTNHKPIILRGARQVGKTTLINQFSDEFETYLYLNLDKKSDLRLFDEDDLPTLIDRIYVHCRKTKGDGDTLLFIDEIQNSPQAVHQLRYFYEQAPWLYVVAAGSLLESLIDNHISFPVGRVEYVSLAPCSFLEFLDGIGESFDAGAVRDLKGDGIHDRLMNHFLNYMTIGGMPEVVMKYAERRDILAVDSIYSTFLNAYADDVEKYSRNSTHAKVIRHIITRGWAYAGENISFANFGASDYRSREVSDAFLTIEKALLLELVYPIVEPRLPLLPNLRRRPKLVWLDTGLVNYYAGVRREIFDIPSIMTAWKGRIAEHIVAQELAALTSEFGKHRYFWARDKEGSSAEVDFVYQYDNIVVPIEVKSGTNAHLRSMHQYMNLAPHDLAVRVWTNPYSVDTVTTNSGKKFRLINLPFYYLGQLNEIIRRNL